MAGELSGIGVGRALTGKGELFAPLVARKMAADRQPKKLLEPKDFKVDNKDLYPLYAHQIALVKSDFGNQWNDLKNKVGDQEADYQMNLRRPEFEEKINGFQNSNAANLAMDKAERGRFIDPQAQQRHDMLLNPSTTGEQWAALHNPKLGMSADANFGYDAKPIPTVDIEKIATSHLPNMEDMTMETDPKKIKSVRIPNSNTIEHDIPMQPTDASVAAKAQSIVGDETAIKNYENRYRDSNSNKNEDWDNTDPDKRRMARQSEIEGWVRSQIPSSFKHQSTTLPKETESEKKKAWTREGNTFQNDKNKITVENLTPQQLPKFTDNIDYNDAADYKEGQQIKNSKNIKFFGYSHTDATDNKALSFMDRDGNPVVGRFLGYIGDGTSKESMLKTGKAVVLTSVPAPTEDNPNATAKKWKILPLQINDAKIGREHGKDLSDAWDNLIDKSGTKQSSGKQASAQQIKSLVGKPGYEGYSEQELMDFYKKQGYNIH